MNNIATTDYFFTVKMVSQNEIWVAGRTQDFSTVIYRTLNGGQTWQKSYGTIPEWFFTMDAAGGYVWGAGYGGMVMRADMASNVQPTSMTVQPGSALSGTLGSLFASDDNRLVMRPGPVAIATQSPLALKVESTSPVGNASLLQFSVESHAGVGGLEQRVELFDFVDGTYDIVSTKAIGLSDSREDVTIASGVARYINQTSKLLRARISFRPTGGTPVYPWQARVDMVGWRLLP